MKRHKASSEENHIGDAADESSTLVGFGKHAHLTYRQLRDQEPGYCQWVCREQASGHLFARLQQYLLRQPSSSGRVSHGTASGIIGPTGGLLAFVAHRSGSSSNGSADDPPWLAQCPPKTQPIMRLFLQGLSIPEIARRQLIQQSTVQQYLCTCLGAATVRVPASLDHPLYRLWPRLGVNAYMLCKVDNEQSSPLWFHESRKTFAGLKKNVPRSFESYHIKLCVFRLKLNRDLGGTDPHFSHYLGTAFTPPPDCLSESDQCRSRKKLCDQAAEYLPEAIMGLVLAYAEVFLKCVRSNHSDLASFHELVEDDPEEAQRLALGTYGPEIAAEAKDTLGNRPCFWCADELQSVCAVCTTWQCVPCAMADRDGIEWHSECQMDCGLGLCSMCCRMACSGSLSVCLFSCSICGDDFCYKCQPKYYCCKVCLDDRNNQADAFSMPGDAVVPSLCLTCFQKEPEAVCIHCDASDWTLDTPTADF